MTLNGSLTIASLVLGILSWVSGPVTAGLIATVAPWIGAIILVLHDPEGP